MSAVEIDANRRLAVPCVYEASVYRIDFGRKQLVVHCREPGGQRFRLNIRGVVHMVGNRLAEENILRDASILSGTEVTPDLLARMLDASTPAQIEYRKRLRQRLLDKSLMLFQLSPAYGGEISIICEQVDFDVIGGVEGAAGRHTEAIVAFS